VKMRTSNTDRPASAVIRPFVHVHVTRHAGQSIGRTVRPLQISGYSGQTRTYRLSTLKKVPSWGLTPLFRRGKRGRPNGLCRCGYRSVTRRLTQRPYGADDEGTNSDGYCRG